jgi:hydroxysqualene synthase
MLSVSVDHYENFPVASWLCPSSLRPAVEAIYRFARTADDIADEGSAAPSQRLSDLAAYRADLAASATGRGASRRWPDVFESLSPVLAKFQLPLELLTDLLSAFEQDVVKTRYADRAELLDYCRRSANPIGRLLLHLYGVADTQALRRSDAICTALQLANFWQDLGVDMRRGRLYIPEADCARHGVSISSLLGAHAGPGTRALVGDLVQWTRSLMCTGAPLVHQVQGRAGWELRLVVQGGLRILEKVEGVRRSSLQTRPRLHAADMPLLLWRALWMRRDITSVARESA